MSGFYQNACKPEGLGGKLMMAMMNTGHAPLARWGFSHLEPEKTCLALDIGCGGGANLAQLLTLCPLGHVTGVDYSPVSVETSSVRNAAAIKAGLCTVLRGDVSALPFEPERFDLVTAFETVYFWPDIENAFRQVCRVLKPGGCFFICNEADGLNAEDDKWTGVIDGMKIYRAGQLTELLTAAGFENCQTDGDTERHWVCVRAVKPRS